MRKFIILVCFAIIASNVLAQPIDQDENNSDWDDVEDSLDTDGNDVDNVPESDSDEDEVSEEDGEDGPDNAIGGDVEDEDECETICPRIYRPICAQIRGSLVTFPTRCELDNKIRCAKASLGAEQAAAIYSYVHNGPCDEE